MGPFKKKERGADQTFNNSIFSMDNKRLRDISNMSVDKAKDTYDRLVGSAENVAEKAEAQS